MKMPLRRLATHRLSTLKMAIKDLSLDELKELSTFLSQEGKRTSKAKLEALKVEMRNRKTSYNPIAIYGVNILPSAS